MLSFLRAPSSPFHPPPLLHTLITSPLKFFSQLSYNIFLVLRGPTYGTPAPPDRIRLVCISDTHTSKLYSTSSTCSTDITALPPGDVLIHAGDLSNDGTFSAIQDQISWLSSLPYKHKIVIAGNHDSYFYPNSRHPDDGEKVLEWGSVSYLQHSSIRLHFPERGGRYLNFYGAPQIPACGGSDFAFQYPRGEDAWSGTIPLETDVLVTHTPPKHHLDLPIALGCEWLLKEVWRTRPKVHVFGHVHAGIGTQRIWWDEAQRAYEKIMERQGMGFVPDFIDVRNWINYLEMLVWSMLGILWSRIWGGEGSGSIMINAALMHHSSGKLVNSPTVIEI